MEASESKVPMILGHEYGKMPDAVTALRCARHIITEEKRWTTGTLMEGPSRQESLAAVHKKPEATCTNVKVCAVGALVLVIGNGPAIDQYFDGGADDDDDALEVAILKDHPVGEPAMLALGEAVCRIQEEPSHEHGERETQLRRSINIVESLNDGHTKGDYEGEDHLNSVIRVFDLAIKIVESDEPPAAA